VKNNLEKRIEDHVFDFLSENKIANTEEGIELLKKELSDKFGDELCLEPPETEFDIEMSSGRKMTISWNALNRMEDRRKMPKTLSVDNQIKLLEMSHKYWHCTALNYAGPDGSHHLWADAMGRMEHIRGEIEELMNDRVL